MITAQAHQSWTHWIESDAWSRQKTAVPMLPTTIGKIMTLALDPDVSVAQLTQVISKDQVLATRVLRLANSAHCGPLEEITTINQATIRIGTAAVRNVVLAVCLSSRLAESRMYGARGRSLLDHSIGTASMAGVLAPSAGVNKDEAFLCGLLHDIGKLFILKLAKDAGKLGAPSPADDEVAAVLRTHHAAMGAHLLRAWQLPALMVEAVQCHHSPASAVLFPRQVAVTSVANRFSHRYGFGCEATRDDSLLENETAQSVGVTASWLAELDKTAVSLFDTARDVIAG